MEKKKHKERKKPLHKGVNSSAAVDLPDYFWERFFGRKTTLSQRDRKVSAIPTQVLKIKQP